MRKIIFITSLLFYLLLFPKSVFAVDCTGGYNPRELNEDSVLTITVQNTQEGMGYHVTIFRNNTRVYPKLNENNTQYAQANNQTLIWSVKLADYSIRPGDYQLVAQSLKIGPPRCLDAKIEIKSRSQADCPAFTGTSPPSPTEQNDVILLFEKSPRTGLNVRVDNDNYKIFRMVNPDKTMSIGSYKNGEHFFEVFPMTDPQSLCYGKKSFIVGAQGISPTPAPGPVYQPQRCGPENEGVLTAVGCILTNPTGLVNSLLKIILFLSGGITLLLIISGGYRMMVSQGNPEKLQEAKETITSAIVGLLFIIFSLVLLEVIGVDILRIPGFGK